MRLPFKCKLYLHIASVLIAFTNIGCTGTNSVTKEVQQGVKLAGTQWELNYIVAIDTIRLNHHVTIMFGRSEVVLQMDTIKFFGKYKEYNDVITDSFGGISIPRSIRRELYSKEILSWFGNDFWSIASHNEVNANIVDYSGEIISYFVGVHYYSISTEQLTLIFRGSNLTENFERNSFNGLIKCTKVK